MFFWRKKPAPVLTAAEIEQLKLLPLGTDRWAAEDWQRWHRLLDLGAVAIVDVEGDFTTSHLLMLTPTGERLK